MLLENTRVQMEKNWGDTPSATLRKREVKSPSFKRERDMESDIKEHDDETTSSDDEIARKDDETTRSDDEIARKDDETTSSDDEIARKDDETTRSDDETTDIHQEMKQLGTLYVRNWPCRKLKMTTFFNKTSFPSGLEWNEEEGLQWSEEGERIPVKRLEWSEEGGTIWTYDGRIIGRIPVKKLVTLYIRNWPCQKLKMTSFPSELEWSKEGGLEWSKEGERIPVERLEWSKEGGRILTNDGRIIGETLSGKKWTITRVHDIKKLL
ncbi:uncharacterized protein LOC111104116 [Crassostrea virginica]